MIQAYSDLGHDCIVGNYSSLESYVFMGGCSKIGEMVTMHTKSSILPHKSLGNNCVVGVSSTVMRNFKSNSNLFGTPATVMEL